MEHADLRPKQRAQYVSIDDPDDVEGYVDELCQNMGEDRLRLHSVVPMLRGGNTVGLWLFFTRVPYSSEVDTLLPGSEEPIGAPHPRPP